MSDIPLLDPKEIEVELPGGGSKKYIISKIPCVPSREILCMYPVTAMPKLGNYKENETLMFKLMHYVGVPLEKGVLRLTTQELINNHIQSPITSLKIEDEMFFYNYGFFLREKVSDIFTMLARALDQFATKIATDLSQPSSHPVKPPSTNSEQSTA